jgi:hypothetical protein
MERNIRRERMEGEGVEGGVQSLGNRNAPDTEKTLRG